MNDIVEIGTVSSRGQICIPNNIRENMKLESGSKVLFLLTNDSLVVKRVTSQTFEEITRPLKEEMNKSKMKESDVSDLVHRFKQKR